MALHMHHKPPPTVRLAKPPVTVNPSSTVVEPALVRLTTCWLLLPTICDSSASTPSASVLSLLSMSPDSTVRLAVGSRWSRAFSLPAKPPYTATPLAMAKLMSTLEPVVGLYSPFFTHTSVQTPDALRACVRLVGTAQLLPSLKPLPPVVTRQMPAQAGAQTSITGSRNHQQARRDILSRAIFFTSVRRIDRTRDTRY